MKKIQSLDMEMTKSTPRVVFDAEHSRLRLEGQSYPENAFKFYEPIFSAVDEYLQSGENEMELELYFHMPYINTSSSKCVMMLLDKLEDAYVAGKKVKVAWFYDRDNEMALECAEEFSEDLSLPFEISIVGAVG